MKRITLLILGLITLSSAWSTLKMIVALFITGRTITVSYAPLPFSLDNPNKLIIFVSIIIYIIITLILATITAHYAKSRR
ncbi:hypothetical protein [Staphylococcus pettenkoferi]|uniref:Uncharacterized protein n=1 Tax=Staphylococcus pettenkoferi TaxID=170573 RepID=A0A9Q4GZY5_9STAP|nr:hypothetical protein [Staphylococcus pettenkoferi]MCY1569238.1 hypothetical protein [Staphylococcus pettenkoferi]MCY1576975.1 hypothetical protein [Staphylococcus pettenkoferi]MCY1595077.1 hypothetical protein [Staphylococcus pettenkoferi]MCY1618812.1 hypothetical protein [Staphylococcus pettenkoferi]